MTQVLSSFQLMQTPPFPPSLSHHVYVSIPLSLRVIPFQCVLSVKSHPGFFAVLWYFIHGRCVEILSLSLSIRLLLFACFWSSFFLFVFRFIHQPFVHACNMLSLPVMQSISYMGRSKASRSRFVENTAALVIRTAKRFRPSSQYRYVTLVCRGHGCFPYPMSPL